MAAINPWASWGVLTDQSWGMAAVDPWASWALYPQDPGWRVEETPKEVGRAAGLLTAQVQGSRLPSLRLSPCWSKEKSHGWSTHILRAPVQINEMLEGRHFDDIQDIEGNTTTALLAIPEKEFQNCFEGWTRRWHWCIAFQGEHFEGDRSDIQQ
ncbi:zinc finger protein 606 isoform X17 [Rhinolophus sinicus]|uniref:zinc finger protein 606 isoform X17 n=1 Tax=Rhinolophus sinicus TaxID=89399 RepID=UPI003D79E7BC